MSYKSNEQFYGSTKKSTLLIENSLTISPCNTLNMVILSQKKEINLSTSVEYLMRDQIHIELPDRLIYHSNRFVANQSRRYLLFTFYRVM